jgi:hypothetical protein
MKMPHKQRAREYAENTANRAFILIRAMKETVKAETRPLGSVPIADV